MSEDRLILEGIVRRLEGELSGVQVDGAGYWEAGDDGATRAAPLPPEIAEAGRVGQVHLLDALETARAALRSGDEESLSWAARWCQAIALAGREMERTDRELRFAELAKEKAEQERRVRELAEDKLAGEQVAVELLQQRRRSGGRTTGEKRAAEARTFWAPYQQQYAELRHLGNPVATARAKIRQRILRETGKDFDPRVVRARCQG